MPPVVAQIGRLLVLVLVGIIFDQFEDSDEDKTDEI